MRICETRGSRVFRGDIGVCGAFVATMLMTSVLSARLAAQELAVVSRGSNVVVFHDLGTGRETGRIPVGVFPHEMAIDVVRQRAFVASYGGDAVYAIDLRTRTARLFRLDGHTSLHGLALDPAGRVVWVTAEDSGSVLELDAESGEVLRAWPTEGDLSHMVVAMPGAQKLYVANIESGDVSVIDREAETTRRIATGAGAEGIDVSPEGAEVWVSNRAENTISVIETASDRVVATMNSGGTFPVKLRMRPDGSQVWIANNQSASVAVFDTETREQVASIDVGARPLGLAFNETGSRAYVTRPGADEVVEINTSTFTIERRLTTGSSPDGVVWIPAVGAAERQTPVGVHASPT